MFEIGFSELLLLAVIAIVVVGPQRLPELVRGFVRIKRKISELYFDVNYKVQKELELDKIEQELYDEEMKKHIEQLNSSVMNSTYTYNDLIDPNEYADTGIELNKKDKQNSEKS